MVLIEQQDKAMGWGGYSPTFALNHTRLLLFSCSHVRYVFYLLRDGIYRVDLPVASGRDSEAMHIVESCTLKDFAVKPQSKRIIYFNDTTQVFTSTFLDGSASHLVLPRVPFANVKSFACENNDFLVTDGKAVFQQDALSFNEFIVGCDLSHIEEFGFGNLVIFSTYAQPHPLPGRPQQLSVLFGSHQALVQWKPPDLAIGASECPSLSQLWPHWKERNRLTLWLSFWEHICDYSIINQKRYLAQKRVFTHSFCIY